MHSHSYNIKRFISGRNQSTSVQACRGVRKGGAEYREINKFNQEVFCSNIYTALFCSPSLGMAPKGQDPLHAALLLCPSLATPPLKIGKMV